MISALTILVLVQFCVSILGASFSLWCVQQARRAMRRAFQSETDPLRPGGSRHLLAMEPIIAESIIASCQMVGVASGARSLWTDSDVHSVIAMLVVSFLLMLKSLIVVSIRDDVSEHL